MGLKDVFLLPTRVRNLYAAVNRVGKDVDDLAKSTHERLKLAEKNINEAHARLNAIESIDHVEERSE